MDGQGNDVEGGAPIQPDGGIPVRQLSLGAMLTHIPKFTGGNLPLHDWAQRMRGMFKVAGVTTENQGEILLIALEGHAQETVLLRPESERKTLEQVVKILERVYGGKPEAGDLQAQLFYRLQGEEEGLPQYANALQRLMRQMHTAEPELAQTPGYADRTLRDQFLRGLYNPVIKSALRERLRVEKKLTFQELLEEAVSRTQAENSDPRSAWGEVLTHRAVASEGAQDPRRLEAKVDQLQETVVALQELLKNIQAPTKTLVPETSPAAGQLDTRMASYQEERGRAGHGRPRPPREYQCWNCGNWGHLARHCTIKRVTRERPPLN